MTLRLLIVSVVLILSSASALALEEKKFCIYDPVGTSGPSMIFLSGIVPKAMSWGLSVKLIAFTDEKVASNSFKAGECDVVFLTIILTQQYVPFGGALNAIGGIISENGVNQVLKAITNPKAGKLLTNRNHEIVGSFPIGGVYLFVNDRNIDSIGEFSGKKVSILSDDPQSLRFTNMVGSSPVRTTLTTFSGQFNNGNIDILPAVPIAYNIFELYRGLGEKGGIIDEKLFFAMMQLVSHKDRFSVKFGQQMRDYILSRLNDIHKLANDSKAEIPSKYWIKTSDETKFALEKIKQDIRLALRDDGILDRRALKLLWKIRCSEDLSRSECSNLE